MHYNTSRWDISLLSLSSGTLVVSVDVAVLWKFSIYILTCIDDVAILLCTRSVNIHGLEDYTGNSLNDNHKISHCSNNSKIKYQKHRKRQQLIPQAYKYMTSNFPGSTKRTCRVTLFKMCWKVREKERRFVQSSDFKRT